MPSPSTTLATLRPELAGTMLEFDLAADRLGFIGLDVLPSLDVAEVSGTFGKIPIEQLLKEPATRRAPRAAYARDNFTFTSDSYVCEEHGLEGVVDEREARMYRNFFEAEAITTERTRDRVLRAFEKRIADLVFNTGTWTGATLTTAVTHKWSDGTNATPVDDVEAAVRRVADGVGMWPNAIIMTRRTFRNLRMVDQIMDRIASSGAGNPTKATDVTTAMLAQVFDLPRIIVAGSIRNSANEGQDASLSSIWTDSYAMIARLAETTDIQEPCLGRTFHWGEDGSQIGGVVESYGEVQVRGDVIRVRMDTDEKILYTACGHLLTNVA